MLEVGVALLGAGVAFAAVLRAGPALLGLGRTMVGVLLVGALGEAVGLPTTVLVGALGVLLACFWVALSPARSLRTVPAVDEQGPPVGPRTQPPLRFLTSIPLSERSPLSARWGAAEGDRQSRRASPCGCHRGGGRQSRRGPVRPTA